MSINFTAKNIVPTIKAFGYHESDKLWVFTIDGIEFTIDDGIIGFVSPVGWFEVHNFNLHNDMDAVANIQWVVDTYSTNTAK